MRPWDNAIPLGYYEGKVIPPYTHRADGAREATVEVVSPNGTLAGGATYNVILLTSLDGVSYSETQSDPITAATAGASGTVDLPGCRWIKVRVECSSGEHLLAGTLAVR